jgi:hypothetical protein
MTGRIINWIGIVSLALIVFTIAIIFQNMSFIKDNSAIVIENQQRLKLVEKILDERTAIIELVPAIDKAVHEEMTILRKELDECRRGRSK